MTKPVKETKPTKPLPKPINPADDPQTQDDDSGSNPNTDPPPPPGTKGS